MARAIDKQPMLDLIIEAKRTDPETGSFAEWLAEYLVERLPTLTPPNEPLTLEELRDTARESREIAQVFNMVADIIERRILPSDWRNADHADDAPGEVAS